MTNEKALIEFVRFLYHEHILKQFVANYYDCIKKHYSIREKNYLKNSHYMLFVYDAFFWPTTKEGTYFWREINHKWTVHISKLLKENDT